MSAPTVWQQHWPEFSIALQRRLQAGHLEYGDTSFERTDAELARELEEELLDVAGWALVRWARLRRLRGAVE